jgi:signal transduction histidine kinase
MREPQMSNETLSLLGELDAWFSLVWLFVVFITVLMLLLCYLFLAKRNAQQREWRSMAFSREALAGQEAERRRIFRELHDDVLPELRGQAVSSRIRDICAELLPPGFERLALKDAIAGLCSRFSRRTRIECGVSIAENLDFSILPVEHQLHLYRMIQESLTNIEKHSRAKTAAVTARMEQTPAGQSILMSVSDDGVGMGKEASAGFGMNTLYQRAAIIGARLRFSSGEGEGMMVYIEIIIPPRGI